jgi:dihydrofolate reductase
MSSSNSNIALIAAVSQNLAIGKDNELLFYLPSDLKRFKRITTGHTIVMGRKTFQSLPNGALPNRRNIVLTKGDTIRFEGCETYHSIEEVLEAVKGESEVFVIGGGEIYRQFYPLANSLYLTMVHQDFEGDTFFPSVNFKEWNVVSQEDMVDEKNNFSYSNIDLKRI